MRALKVDVSDVLTKFKLYVKNREFDKQISIIQRDMSEKGVTLEDHSREIKETGANCV